MCAGNLLLPTIHTCGNVDVTQGWVCYWVTALLPELFYIMSTHTCAHTHTHTHRVLYVILLCVCQWYNANKLNAACKPYENQTFISPSRKNTWILGVFLKHTTFYIITLLHCYSTTVLHCYPHNATVQLQCYSITLLQHYIITLQYYNNTATLCCCIVISCAVILYWTTILLDCYTDALLRRYNIVLLHCYTI